jgi:hypothetical protein
MNPLMNLNPVLRDIKHYFGFLFDNGYQIRDKDIGFLAARNWEVILESPECLIKIFSDQYEVFLVFSPVNVDIDNRLGIKSLIYYLSKGQKFIGKFEGDYKDRKKQLERLASLLKEYIDQITPYFENYEFQRYKSDLLKAQQEYYDIYIRKYMLGFEQNRVN